MDNILKQYDRMGKEYISGQEKFYGDKNDEASQFLIDSLGNIDNKIILDFGCGHGKDILTYEKLGPKEIYGIDISEMMVEEAKKRVKDPSKIQVCNIEQTPFEDSFFDAVVSRYGFHYLKENDIAYAEMARILKPGGKMALILPHPFSDLMLQKEKVYGNGELIELDLYTDRVKIVYPVHKMEEFLTKEFLKHFCLTGFLEGTQADAIEKEELGLPAFLGISAVKRNTD